MLPAGSRLRHRADFTATLRRSRGSRGNGLLVVHAAAPVTAGPDPAPRVGLVVPRTVGPAVTRNRVKRRLRHLMAERLVALPAGTSVVVRALPPSGTAPFGALAGALDRALAGALGRPRVTAPARAAREQS